MPAPTSTPVSPRATEAPPGRPPERIEAHFYVCPPGFEVAAYGQVFYLPNHPSRSKEATRPDRCFSSAVQARRSGYRDAPVPPSVLVIGGVFLVPPDGALMTYCQRAAERLHRSVPCPTLVPGQADSRCGPGGVPGP
jgi:hypothetical protein